MANKKLIDLVKGEYFDTLREEPEQAPQGELRWHVVRTENNRERTAASHMIGRRIAVYLPIRTKVVRANRYSETRMRTLRLPLFPGYMFAQVYQDRCGRILSMPGVTDFLRFRASSNPVTVPQEAIDALRIGEDARNAAHGEKTLHQFEVGEMVRIRSGAWGMFTGPIFEFAKGERIKVAVQLFGRENLIEVSLSEIEAV